MPAFHRLPPHWSLPVAPEPVIGESWMSLLRRAADINDTTVGKLCAATGVVNDDVLTPPQQAAAASLVSLPEDQIQALTLNRWAGIAFSKSLRSTPNGQGPSWTWTAPRSHCQQCIANGVARLAWRLPWITVCLVHKQFLRTQEEIPPKPEPEDLALTGLFIETLGTERTRQHFDVWRDATRLAIGLRRVQTSTRATDPAPIRSKTLQAAAPLALASSPGKRAEVLAAWCEDLHVPQLWDNLRRMVQSRPLIDAADTVAATVWYRSRAI